MVQITPQNPSAYPVTCDVVQFKPRSYQLEMLEASLKGNIIVAMDTGSGKTQVAFLRIMEEIERGLKAKRIWFLAPTVALCTQHYENMGDQMPALRIRILLGSDNVERWKDQRIWDAALFKISVVISTHAVLADALSHGFVKIGELNLLIFDEAHWCVGNHPANCIMRDFYHPELQSEGRKAVPSILGLSASPSKPNALHIIETNLNAVVKTPRVHRDEMMRYVHRPRLYRLEYLPIVALDGPIHSRALQMLRQVYSSVWTTQSADTTALADLFVKLSTLSQAPSNGKQIRKFLAKAYHVYEELGSWAADYFILESVERLKASIRDEDNLSIETRDYGKEDLLRMLKGILEAKPRIDLAISTTDQYRFSPKLRKLISFLISQDDTNFSGLIFAQQRVTVNVLSKLLSVHPDTKSRFKCAGFVGLSNNSNQKLVLGDLSDTKAQSNTLTDFRERTKNLIVTTEALEEGIDIPACHLVVSYNTLPTLKSFIQRRGRARQRASTFGIMVPGDDQDAFDKWQNLEKQMIAEYQTELRILQETAMAQSDEEVVPDSIRVPSTRAFLTADAAVAHLFHFCNKLTPQPYVDLRPAYKLEEVDNLFKVTISLPNSVNASVRERTGLRFWKTERLAIKDAAMQVYKALYGAGLLNDNLLPLSHEEELGDEIDDDLPRTILVSAQYNPWIEIAENWSSHKFYEIKLLAEDINRPQKTNVSMSLILPSVLPVIRPFYLFGHKKTSFKISFQEPKAISSLPESAIIFGRNVTDLLIRSAHSDNKPSDQTDFVALFVPSTDPQQLKSWLDAYKGSRPAADVLKLGNCSPGLLRSAQRYNVPLVFDHCEPMASEQADDEATVFCAPLRRGYFPRTNIPDLSSTDPEDAESKPQPSRLYPLPMLACTVDRLPLELSVFGLFIPLILGQLELTLVASRLSQGIIKDVGFQDIDHVITAISAPSVQWATSYERYEFLGDSLLKFVVSTQLYADHANWHEGVLSRRRNSLVCNKRLAKAAIAIGLDAFVLTTPFLERKWAAPMISELQAGSSTQRNLSQKVLADVVEALIGAAFLDHGLAAAQSCMHVFLPDIRCYPVTFEPSFQHHFNGERSWSLEHQTVLEELIGYEFVGQSIFLEAFTHPSCQRDESTESYQRLEFLGDAVLDMVVASTLFADCPDFPQGRMTEIKAALVNAQFLAFLMLELTFTQEILDIHEPIQGEFCQKHGTKKLHLWQFMRHDSEEIGRAEQACVRRYNSLREDIHLSLKKGKSYPWVLLTKLNADKFFSDLVEAVFGAIFVDSGGDLTQCTRFAERIGLLEYLRRIAGGVEVIDVSHPKNVLGHLANSKKVDYAAGYQDGDGERGFFCKIIVGDTFVGEAHGCATKQEASVMAADRAAEYLKKTTTD